MAEFLVTIQGFRKFIICFMVLIVSIIFRVKNLVNGSEWAGITQNVSIGFFGTNSAESLFSIVKEHLALRRAAGSLTTPPKDPSPDDGNEEVELSPAGDSK